MPPLQYTRKDTESPEPARAPGRQRLRCFAGAEGAKVSNDFFIFSVNVKQNTAHITPHAYGGCGGGGRVIRSACGCVLTPGALGSSEAFRAEVCLGMMAVELRRIAPCLY